MGCTPGRRKCLFTDWGLEEQISFCPECEQGRGQCRAEGQLSWGPRRPALVSRLPCFPVDCDTRPPFLSLRAILAEEGWSRPHPRCRLWRCVITRLLSWLGRADSSFTPGVLPRLGRASCPWAFGSRHKWAHVGKLAVWHDFEGHGALGPPEVSEASLCPRLQSWGLGLTQLLRPETGQKSPGVFVLLCPPDSALPTRLFQSELGPQWVRLMRPWVRGIEWAGG